MSGRGGEPDLFSGLVEEQLSASQPLAARMRPTRIDDLVGQEQILSPEGFLQEAIAADRVPSMILYGPPGSGKTTLARVIAASTASHFEELSAVSATLAEVRAVLEAARDRLAAGTRTVLFLDEIHRFNKAQQDALLPAVEDGLITLIGATTENPWYEVNAALISRTRVVVLERLEDDAMARLLERAVAAPEGMDGKVTFTDDGRAEIIARASGDARGALNLLEAASAGLAPGGEVTAEVVARAAAGRGTVYDRDGDQHYNYISAFIKSVRASDADAALYYLAAMIQGGEDPKYIARRLIVLASEDIGNADPQGLVVATACARGVEFVGMPEGRIILAQATTYLALAPKSNASYRGIRAAMAHVQERGAREPPVALRDASSRNKRNLGHGDGYRYPHDAPDAVLPGSLLPEGLEDLELFTPTDRGVEGRWAERLRELRERGRGGEPGEEPRPF